MSKNISFSQTANIGDKILILLNEKKRVYITKNTFNYELITYIKNNYHSLITYYFDELKDLYIIEGVDINEFT